MTDIESRVRREAQPFAIRLLSKSQSRAIEQLHEWLDDFIVGRKASSDSRKSEEREVPSYVAVVSEDRPSNVVMFDGDRGVGKTSALLSTLSYWRELLSKPIAQDKSEKAGAARDAALGRDNPLWNPDRTCEIHPLGIVDVHEISPHADLLTAILSRFYECVEYVEKSRAGAWGSREDSQAMKAWHDVQRSVAIGRPGNLGLRRSSLDPDTYAAELVETERQNLHVADKWRVFVSAITADIATCMREERPGVVVREPLFIVPLDDIDMVPGRLPDICDALRTLWSPNVVFLLTGHAAQMQGVLERHLSLAEKDGGRGPLPLDRSTVVARQMLDKVVPRTHRFSLEAELSDEMRRAIAQIILDKAPGTADWLGQFGAADTNALEAFDAFFELTLREGRNLLIDLLEAKEQGPAQMLERLWRHVVSQIDQPFEYKGRSISESQVRSQVRLKVRATQLGPELYVGNEIAITPVDAVQVLEVDSDRKVLVRELRGTEVRIFGHQLSSQVSAAVLLIIAMASRLGDTRVDASMPSLCPVGAAISNTEEGIWLEWPLPHSFGLIERLLLRQAWNRVLDPFGFKNTYLHQFYVDRLARQFIALVIQIGRDAKAWRPRADPPEWEELVSELRLLAGTQSSDLRMIALRSWATLAVPAMAAPEYGLSMEASNKLLDAFPLTPEMSNRLRASRRLTLQKLIPANEESWGSPLQGVERLVEAIDGLQPENEWTARIEGALALRRATAKALLEAAARIHFPTIAGLSSSNSLARLLASSISPDVNDGSPSLLKRLSQIAKNYDRANNAGAAALGAMWRSTVETMGLLETNVWKAIEISGVDIRTDVEMNWVLSDTIRMSVDERRALLLSRIGSRVTNWRAHFGSHPDAGIAEALLLAGQTMQADSEDARPPFRKTPPIFASCLSSLVLGRNVEFRFPWPIPGWAAELDQRLMYEWWNATLAGMEGLLTGGTGISETITDGLACLILLWTKSFCVSRPENAQPGYLELAPSEAYWKSVLQEPQNQEGFSLIKSQSRRALANQRWFRVGRYILAAPEYGLSHRASEALLATAEASDIDSIRALRHGRIAAAAEALGTGVFEDWCNSELGSSSVPSHQLLVRWIDAGVTTNHPWFDRFGR